MGPADPAPDCGAGAAKRHELHMSLSRTLPVAFHLKDSLLAELRTALAPVQSFSLQLRGTRVFTNDERTRTFVSVPLLAGSPGAKVVLRMIGRVNTAFLMHGLQVYYQVYYQVDGS
ncbi:hypothetical protein FOA52_001754 [Chlamydomonas sp. UWO 241]|nr:hypothetical protein FOA52_001754 [Chlamydomonas sp. UWO 241]